MTAIVVGVNPKRIQMRQYQHAKEYLAERGFEEGAHYQTKEECIQLAAKVICELAMRSSLNEHGWYAFKVSCHDGDSACKPECRGWDGHSKKCDCGQHFVRLTVAYRNFPAVDHEIECICCDFCGDRPYEQEPECSEGHRHCYKCWGDHRDFCFG